MVHEESTVSHITSYQNTVPPDQSPRPPGWTVSLDNPWIQIMFRWYKAKKEYSPPLIALNEREIRDAEEMLAYLRSEKMEAHKETHLEDRPAIAQRERDAIACIEKNQTIISRHNTSLETLKNKLIRYGFIEEQEWWL